MIEFEEEIEILENVLSNIEAAIGDAQDSPYHSYLAQTWEHDKEDIIARLEELYAIQDEQFAREMKELNIKFEEVRI